MVIINISDETVLESAGLDALMQIL